MPQCSAQLRSGTPVSSQADAPCLWQLICCSSCYAALRDLAYLPGQSWCFPAGGTGLHDQLHTCQLEAAYLVLHLMPIAGPVSGQRTFQGKVGVGVAQQAEQGAPVLSSDQAHLSAVKQMRHACGS